MYARQNRTEMRVECNLDDPSLGMSCALHCWMLVWKTGSSQN